MPNLTKERPYMEKAVEMIANGEERVLFDMMTYPLTVRLWIEEISGKASLRLGIHQVDSDRLRSYFLVTGDREEIDRYLRQSSIVDTLMKHLENLTLRWIQSDDD